MIPVFHLDQPADAEEVTRRVTQLRLSPADFVNPSGERGQMLTSVRRTIADVVERGDAAVLDATRTFDDPTFTQDQFRVTGEQMRQAVGRLDHALLSAIDRSIKQVREYQTAMMPKQPPTLEREGLKLGLRFTPIDSAGIYFPGGRASYPSSLIMLAVPAQVAGVKRLTVVTPPSRFGRSDVVLATAHLLGISEMFLIGGAAAVAALAVGTVTVERVDKIVGPGNIYVQLAKREVAGLVGTDGFLGPSEILTLADDSANPRFIAADLLAQAEHDPGSCFLLTDSQSLADAVLREVETQLKTLTRSDVIEKALREGSMICVGREMSDLITLANTIAAEHVNLQTSDDEGVLSKLRHAGAVFVGGYSPVAAGDYVAGPSHCLPTNTTARYASGISVYEFLKRSSIVEYSPKALSRDAPSIVALAGAEGLDAHAGSILVRTTEPRS